jgi:cyclophilin family peptidyl-prolyl cis-trans isomerase/HEAT repeat protein
VPSTETHTGWTFAFPVLPPQYEGEIVWVEDGRDDPQKLAHFVSDPLPSIRARTAIALGRIGSPGCLSLLQILMHDLDPRVRAAAAFGLGEMMEAHEEIGPLLRSHILPGDEADPAVRALSVEALSKLGIAEDPALLARALEDPDRRVVEAALLSLWRLSPEGMASMALELSRDPDPQMRWKAAYALMRLAGAPPSGRTPIPGAAPLPEALRAEIRERFLELVSDPHAAARLQAIRGLGGMTGDGIIERVRQRETDEDPRVRVEVARCLGRLKAPSSSFKNLLHDSSDPVRLAAVRAMTSCPDVDAAFEMVRGPQPPDEVWRREAILTTSVNLLGETDEGGEGHEREESDDRGEAHEGKANPKLEKQAQLLSEAFRDEWRIRAEAVRLAAEIDPAGDLLYEILERSTPSEAWMSDEDPRVLKYAVAPLLRNTAIRSPSLAPGRPLRRDVDSWMAHSDEILRAMTVNFLTDLASEVCGPSPEEEEEETESAEETAATSIDLDEPARTEWLTHFHEIMARALDDPSSDVKTTAVDGLAYLSPLDSPQRALLSRVLADPDGHVRSRAASILREEGEELPPDSHRRVGEKSPEELGQILLEARKIREARIETSKGVLVLRLFPDEAPLTVANFAGLAREGYFNDKAWHRVVPDFVAQDGCPRGDGWGGPGHTIRCEISSLRYGAGAMGMALSGKDTGGSQYFITHSPQPHLDGGYTVFGLLREGWDVLQSLAPGDRILTVSVAEGS